MFLSGFARGAVRFIRFDNEDEEDAMSVEDMGQVNQSKTKHAADKYFKGCLLLLLLVLVSLCLATAVILGHVADLTVGRKSGERVKQPASDSSKASSQAQALVDNKLPATTTAVEQPGTGDGRFASIASDVRDMKEMLGNYIEQSSAKENMLAGRIQFVEEMLQRILNLSSANQAEGSDVTANPYCEGQDSGACPSGFSGGEDWSSCYKVVEESVSWHTARLNCLNLGGYLAEINSEEELQYLDQTYGARKYYEFWVAAVQADPGNENSQFVWDRSRIPILGSMWLPNQPSDSGQNEDHAEVMLGRRGRPGLNDDTGSKSQKYLCETAKC